MDLIILGKPFNKTFFCFFVFFIRFIVVVVQYVKGFFLRILDTNLLGDGGEEEFFPSILIYSKLWLGFTREGGRT